jgi:hypothetical protein
MSRSPSSRAIRSKMLVKRRWYKRLSGGSASQFSGIVASFAPGPVVNHPRLFQGSPVRHSSFHREQAWKPLIFS